jgi:hypothetical protein
MNKRTKELAEQAGSTHKQNLGVYQFYEHELEKFVELIVEDCLAAVEDTLGVVWDDVLAIQKNIKDNFGVKK